jgi:hypothetical protein
LESQVPTQGILASALTVAIHPGAFYLVVGYSESLFLAMYLGLIYWTQRWLKSDRPLSAPTSSSAWTLAAIHGFIGAATRFAGFPIATFPIFQSLRHALQNNRARLFPVLLPALVLSGVVFLGLISFFIYCHFAFGKWNLYFILGQIGWGLSSQGSYWVLFNPLAYIPRYFFEDTMVSVNRTAVPWTMGLWITALCLDQQKMKRLGFYASAFALLYSAMIGKANADMDGMIRYSLPAFVPIILCLTQILKERPELLGSVFKSQFRWIVYAGYLLAISSQGWIAWRYLHGRWVS